MIELPKEHLGRVAHLFDPAQPNSTMIFSTLAGRTLGRAYVDEVANPTNCLLVMAFQHFSFTHETVDPHWLNETVAALRPEFGFYLNWWQEMDEKMEPTLASSRSVAGYEFLQYSPQGDLQLPPDRHLQRLDAGLLARAAWRDAILSAFGTVDNFLDKGIGVCVMDGNEICSEAYAIFLGAGKFEIGIVTHEKYRKQGNAYLACKGLLELVEATGYPPHWSYFEGNAASAATARKLGFGAQREYRWFHYPQVT